MTNKPLVSYGCAVFLTAAILQASAQVQNQPGAGPNQPPGLTVPGVQLRTNRYTIYDRGQPRAFEVAADEVWVVTRAGAHRSEKIEPRADAEAVRQYADTLRKETGDEVRLVLYEVGAPRTEYSRRVLTKEVLVQLAKDTDPNALAAGVGGVSRGEVSYAPGFFLFETSETGGALFLAEALRAKRGVLSAEPQLAKQQQKRFLPNDPMFANQWHLRNTGQNGGTAGTDVNVTNVWDAYRGTGVMIGIVDDGLQITHPDLSANVNTQIDWDFNYNDGDPSPNTSYDYHGTACAGVAAGRGNNSLGVSGAAFEATLVGLRLIALGTTDSQEAAAMTHSNEVIWVKSNSWGPYDDGQTLEGPGPVTLSALAQGATTGRSGKGTIYVWAGGNGRSASDNVNYDGYANSIYTIAIAALSDQGFQSDYSEPGACLVVTAPSGSSGRQGITTTDLVGSSGYSSSDYTSGFSGTSSAAPLAAGVIALILQANPNLSWRDLQEILIRSARKVSPADSDWAVNGAGISFNHKFGAGLINAAGAVNLAATWTALGPQTSTSSSQSGLVLSIPDNNTAGITRDFDLSSSNLRVEHVTVTVNITHTFRGDLAITLTSPSGKTSRLAEKHSDSGDNYTNWKFMSVQHWGESSAGTWTVKVADLAAANIGTLNSIRLDLYGTGGTALEVTPASGMASGGPVGGPFTPSSAVYALSNSAGAGLAWTASADQNWASVSPASGNLAAGASADVTVSINANANGLGAGTWTNTVTFINTTSGARQTRAVTLNITPGAILAVTPALGLACSGPLGGPFTPSNRVYALSNSGSANLAWTAGASQNWISVSPASGALAPGTGTNVTVSINANANSLAVGSHPGSVTFTNTTNGNGNTNRTVALVVSPCPVAVFQVTGGGPYCAGGSAMEVGLDGSEANVVYHLSLNGVLRASLDGTGSALSFGLQANAGTYTVQGTNASTGCWSDMIGSAVVTVNARPTAALTNVATICVGSSATISAALRGSPPWDVYWSDGTNQLGVVASPATRSVSPAAPTTYTVTNLTDANCAARPEDLTGSAVVIVYPVPVAYHVAGGGPYCAGGTGVAVGLTNSQVGVNYHLKCDGNTTKMVSGTGLPISFGLQTNAGIYTVVATNVSTACWAEMSGSPMVTINARPTSFVNGSATIRNGYATTISATLSGIPPWNLRWSDGLDQTNVPSSPALRIVSPSVTTNYTVTDLADANCVARPDELTGSAIIVVTNPPPNVAASGDSTFGQCGVPVEAQTTVAIAAGAWHSLALQTDGRVLAWGDNSYGQRAVPGWLHDAVAIAAGGYHSLAIRLNGTVAAWGGNDYGQTNVPAGLTGVIGLAAGTWHSVALRTDGRVVVWGDNSFGQTNQPAGLTNVTAVAAGGNHTLALKADGTVVAWGENTDAEGNAVGQSVVPWGLANVVAIAAGEYHSLAVKGDGTVVAWGDNSQGQCSMPPGLNNVVAAAGGGGHTLALRADGTVAAWGANWSGQCDLPSTLSPALGIAAGGYHTVVLLEDSPPVPPRLLNPARRGSQFSALVQTLHRKHYALEFVDSVVETNWAGICTNAGNGALQIVTDPGATASQRFYRLRQW